MILMELSDDKEKGYTWTTVVKHDEIHNDQGRQGWI